jgi:hypothetical protein
LLTGTQSFKAYEEAQRFFKPSIANDYNQAMNPNAKGQFGDFGPKDIKVNKDDHFLFYVDEEPAEGVALNFVPDGTRLFMFNKSRRASGL